VILLVEDDAISRITFARTLRSYRYGVFEAKDGAEAIALLEHHHPVINLVITDLALPRVNGFNLLTNIQTRWPKIPVVMVSGYLSEEAGKAIVGSHVHILEKPVRPSVLIALVQRIAPAP